MKMLDLPVSEMVIFIFVIVVYLTAAIVGVLQLLAGGEKYKRFLWPLVLVAVTLEVVLLVFRAVAIKAVPLTGLFESMVVLTIVFGLIFVSRHHRFRLGPRVQSFTLQVDRPHQDA